jgi:hypothetical protein
MPKARASVRKIIANDSRVNIDELGSLYEKLLGLKDCDKEVIEPKIMRVFTILKRYYALLEMFINFSDLKEHLSYHSIDYEEWFYQIKTFMKKIDEIEYFSVEKNYVDYDMTSLGSIHSMNESEINSYYKSISDSDVVKTIVISSNNLVEFKQKISNNDGSFILAEPGFNFCPLDFCDLDLKSIWSNIEDQGLKKYMLSFIGYLYKLGEEMHRLMNNPNVDIGEFSDVLINSIVNMKSQLPRCGDAFRIIENSVKMMEDNFQKYYRDSIEAKNPSVMIESFMIDIATSKNIESNPNLNFQFKQIFNFLKRKSSNIKDPKIKKAFEMLKTQFNSLDETSKKK